MQSDNDFNREVTFDIVEAIGVISTYPTGWSKELNLVSWNGGTAKYDIRDWSPNHEHMSRGVTLHEKEMRTIIDLLRKRGRNRRAAVLEELPGAAEDDEGFDENVIQQ